MRGDFDPLQIAIVVLFLIGSFVKWLWENWQARRGSTNLPDQVELENTRENAMRRRGQSGNPPPPPVPSPLDEWRRAWKEMQEAVKPAQTAPPATRSTITPPPLRQQEPKRPPAPQATVAPAQPAASQPATSTPTHPSLLNAMHQLRHEPRLMRQAILMQEILGPPKALQSSAGPAI